MRKQAMVPGTNNSMAGVAAMMANASGGQETDDPVELVNKINAAFEEFKNAQDEQLKNADAVTEEKVTKINAEIAGLQTQLDETLAKQAQKLASIEARGGGAADQDLTAHARAFMLQNAAHRGAGREQLRDMMEQEPDVEALQNYTKAFGVFLAKGCNNSAIGNADMRNDLSLGVDSEGGYLVPPNMTTQFVKRLHEGSPIRQIANVVPVTGDSFEYPTDTNRQPSGGWVAEKANRDATGTAQVGVGEIRAHEAYAYPQVTQKALEDQMLIDPEGWVNEKAADEFALLEGAACVNGDGIGKPFGFLSYGSTLEQDKARAWGKLQHVKTGAAGGFPTLTGDGDDPDAVIDITCSLKLQYRTGAKWVMNRLTEAAFRKLKDNDGKYRWTPPTLPGQPAMLEGYEVVHFEDMPDIATDKFAAAFGNFKEGYTLLDRLGLSLLIDPYTNKPFVGFYFRRRVGGAVTNFDAIKLLKFSL